MIGHDHERYNIDTETTGQVFDTFPSPDSTGFKALAAIAIPPTQEHATHAPIQNKNKL